MYQQPQIVTIPAPVVHQQHQPVLSTTTSTTQHGPVAGYNARTAIMFGIAQMVLGALAFIFAIVAIVLECVQSHVGTGIWCGIFFIFVGSMGWVSGLKKTVSWIIISMTLSIIAAVLSGCIFVIISIVAVAQEKHTYSYGYTRDMLPTYSSRGGKSAQAIDAVLLTIAIVETLVAIVSSVYCYRFVCCTDQPRTPGMMYIASQPPVTYYQTPITTQVTPGVCMVQPPIQPGVHVVTGNQQIRVHQPVVSTSVVYT